MKDLFIKDKLLKNSIDALPDDLSTGHGKAMYTPNGIVDRAQSVGDYHKMANADLSNRISNKIGENYGNLAQAGYNLFSPALSIPASFGYDYSQAKDRMEPDSGIMDLERHLWMSLLFLLLTKEQLVWLILFFNNLE